MTGGDSWFSLNVENESLSEWVIKANATWTGLRQPIPLILAKTELHQFVFFFDGSDNKILHFERDCAPVNISDGFKLTENISFSFAFRYSNSIFDMYYNDEKVWSHTEEEYVGSELKEIGFGTLWNSETKFDFISLFKLEKSLTTFQQIDSLMSTIGVMVFLFLLYGLVAFYNLFSIRHLISVVTFIYPVALCVLLWFNKLPELFAPIPFIAGTIITLGLFIKRQTENKAKLTKSQLTNEQLREQTLDLARSISQFVLDRNNNEPIINFDELKDSVEKLVAYSRESIDLYYDRHSQNIMRIREEFLVRNIKDKEFERLYAHPTNMIGLRMLSLRLAAMASKL